MPGVGSMLRMTSRFGSLIFFFGFWGVPFWLALKGRQKKLSHFFGVPLHWDKLICYRFWVLGDLVQRQVASGSSEA